jgi:murein L,D-transpeptidase YcbB/YkuD
MRSPKAALLLCAFLAAGAAVAPVQAQEPVPPLTPDAPAVETVALDVDAAAIRDGLAAELATLPEAQRAAIAAFYAARQYAPFWTATGDARAMELVAALETAPAQALPPSRYDADALRMLFIAPSASAPARREVAASVAYLRFTDDLSGGILTPSKINPNMTRQPARPRPQAVLAALSDGPLPAVLQGFEPTAPDYRRLVEEKARLEAVARTASWGPAVPDGPTLHPGDSGPRVADLRARLARLGYGAPGGEAVDPAFDATLEAAVQGFQRDYGLNDDGVVGAMTLAAINAPIETRLAQVMVNLERLRWMPRDLGERYLSVNIPDYSVTLYEAGAPAWSSRVVVGKTRVTETPEFSGEVSYMVVNPTWHIPDSIAIRDYLPKLQKDPMVLKRQNIRLLTRGGTEINPKLVDFTQYTPENFPFRIKQRPSDDNALGQVKFMFPNEHAIYLHDTPHREYFARDVRALSNGCIRVEKPTELAELLLAGQEADPAAAFRGWVAAKSERNVTLDRKVPVHIVYRTVWFDEAGAAHYRPDVYGRDAEVFEALEAAGVTLPAAQG